MRVQLVEWWSISKDRWPAAIVMGEDEQHSPGKESQYFVTFAAWDDTGRFNDSTGTEAFLLTHL